MSKKQQLGQCCTLRCLSCSIWNCAAVKSPYKCWSSNKVAVVKKKRENHQKGLWPFYYCSLMWEHKFFAVVAWGFLTSMKTRSNNERLHLDTTRPVYVAETLKARRVLGVFLFYWEKKPSIQICAKRNICETCDSFLFRAILAHLYCCCYIDCQLGDFTGSLSPLSRFLQG